MKTTRRKFFGFVAAAPVAAQSVAEKLVGLSTPSVFGHSGVVRSQVAPSDSDRPRKRLSDFYRLFGDLPEWAIRQARENSKYVHRLDTDIASFRSVSLAAKISMQSERDFQERIRNIKHGDVYDLMQKWGEENSEYTTW